jgi:hypothetical protein
MCMGQGKKIPEYIPAFPTVQNQPPWQPRYILIRKSTMRFLCLHGRGTSSNILEAQLGKTQIK